mmetsp:Transcript_29553/g.81132  ORF Transcript_29553/g.81132 Transcript_29553/m.81132 type:complete len:207 (+) Transcript_29553:440-1060(+)
MMQPGVTSAPSLLVMNGCAIWLRIAVSCRMWITCPIATMSAFDMTLRAYTLPVDWRFTRSTLANAPCPSVPLVATNSSSVMGPNLSASGACGGGISSSSSSSWIEPAVFSCPSLVYLRRLSWFLRFPISRWKASPSIRTSMHALAAVTEAMVGFCSMSDASPKYSPFLRRASSCCWPCFVTATSPETMMYKYAPASPSLMIGSPGL